MQTVQSPAKPKIAYIDRLKVIMTVLVILHHTFITYGAPGGWYFYQKTTNEVAKIPMTLFVAVNQSFFMGFFFFLSAYFMPASLKKKGAKKFLGDRIIRLGIPLVFYSFVLGPLMNYMIYYWGYGKHITLVQYLSGYDSWINFGVLWFVAALLLFTLIYVALDGLIKRKNNDDVQYITFSQIVLFAMTVGIVSFLVRLIFPLGWVLNPVGFQLAYFPQYIALFTAGILASKHKWLDSIGDKQGKRGLFLALLMVLVVFPLLFVGVKVIKLPFDWFNGGWHWQAIVLGLWEQLTGFGITLALIAKGKRSWNNSSSFWDSLSRRAFAVYIFHPLLIISLTLSLFNWNIEPALKLLVVAPLAVAGSFLLASVLILIPGVKKII
ncbi:MAG: acyltransferase [Bacteroidota bacterium]